jgi:hypothetical protein
MTYLAKRQEEIRQLQTNILTLLGWDEMRYNEFMYESGVEFIRRYYLYPDLMRCVERSKTFWNWWKVIWWNQDENMLTFTLPAGFGRQRTLELYYKLHDVEYTKDTLLVPHSVWDEVRKMQCLTPNPSPKGEGRVIENSELCK